MTSVGDYIAEVRSLRGANKSREIVTLLITACETLDDRRHDELLDYAMGVMGPSSEARRAIARWRQPVGARHLVREQGSMGNRRAFVADARSRRALVDRLAQALANSVTQRVGDELRTARAARRRLSVEEIEARPASSSGGQILDVTVALISTEHPDDTLDLDHTRDRLIYEIVRTVK